MYFENDLFTERENDVINLLMEGKSNKQIASELEISNRTVDFHLSNIYTKLGVSLRSEVILKLTDRQLRKSTGDDQVISTVDNSRDSLENGFKSILRKITMEKPYYVIAGLSAAVLLLITVVVNLPTKINFEYVPMPFNQAIATNNDIYGDTVNTASRMESHGEAGKIQVSQATYKLLKDEFIMERRGTIEVKGKGQMTTWFLTGSKEGSKS